MAEAISVDHFVKKMEQLKQEMEMGKLKHGEYDQRLSRLIQELRERRLEADRPQIGAAIDDLLSRGVITDSVKTHLEKRLGLS